MKHRSLRTVTLACAIVSGAFALLWQGDAAAQDHQQTQDGGAKPAAAAKPTGKLVPHPQAVLPPLQLPAYTLPRPPEVIRATYKFAAEHPEVLTYMPCFCGCDQSGHRSNEDCFVKGRAKNGDVTSWNEHGMVCGMCLAVAEQAMKMCNDGASLKDIRAEVERRYGHITGLRTSTPPPPAY